MKSVIVLLSLVSAVAFATDHKTEAAKADAKANVEVTKANADVANATVEGKADVNKAKNKAAVKKVKADGKAKVEAAKDAAKEATK